MIPYCRKGLEKLRSSGLYRSLKTIEGAQGSRVRVNGKDILLFCSNNYLGLASHPYLKEAAKKAIDECGFGSGASRLISGSMGLHKRLEERIAGFKGRERALIFNSGYHANIGLITALAGRGDYIFSDRLNHASIVDGCLLSGAHLIRYPHRDTETLKGLLEKHPSKRRKLIITDGVFSMNGDIAPVDKLLLLSKNYDAMLLIDDAHGVGVMGANGRGTLEQLEIKDESVIEMGTFGKAFGSFGAFVAGSEYLIEYLINKARTFIYTTALPPSVCAASLAALDIAESEPERRRMLLDKAAYLRKRLKDLGLNTMGSESHIVPVLIGGNEDCLDISRRLLEDGVFIQAIRPPTVPEGTGRLRISLMSEHRREDIDYVVELLEKRLSEKPHLSVQNV